MITQHVFDLFINAGITVPAASDDEGSAIYFLLLGPLAGFGFYSMMYIRYRNADKRHEFERETAAAVVDLKTYDQKVNEVKGVRRSRIEGANNNDPLQRLGAGTKVDVLPAPVHPVEEMLRGDAPVNGSTSPGAGDVSQSPQPNGPAGDQAPPVPPQPPVAGE